MNRIGKSLSIVALASVCSMTVTVHAANLLELVSSRIKGAEARTALGADLFGEQVSLATGATEFRVVDVSVPTNSGLRLQLGRRLDLASPYLQSTSVEDYSFEGSTDSDQHHKKVFGRNWELDIPSIRAVFDLRYGWVSHSGLVGNGTTSRCSAGFSPPDFVAGVWPNYYSQIAAKDYWSGTKINVPGVAEETLLSRISGRPSPTGSETYLGTTKSEWLVSCLPSVQNAAGEGFKVRLPDGTVYYFNWMVVRRVPSIGTEESISIGYNAEDGRIGTIGSYNSPRVLVPRAEYALYATRVEDRHGNWITYEYDSSNPQRLLAIRSNEGSAITLVYEHGQISTATAGSQIWTYQYSRPYSSYPNIAVLDSVVLPDQTKWTYSISGLGALNLHTQESKDLWRGCILNIQGMASSLAPDPNRIATVSITHPSGATGVFKFRNIVHGTNRTSGSCAAQNATASPTIYGAIAAFKVSSLYEKTVSGPGVSTGTWSFSYVPTWSWASQCLSATCATTSETRVTAPDNVLTRYTYGNDYDANSGKLLSVKTEYDGSIVEEKASIYVDSSIGQLFADSYGIDPHKGNNPFANKIRPLSTSIIIRDGTTFTRQLSAFDVFGRPAVTTSTNSLGFSRSDVIEYYDNFELWVIGQVKQQYNVETGVVRTKADYNAKALPWKAYAYGKLQQTLTYNAEGNIETAADGRGNTITASNWKRGIPQLILRPATAEAPAGASKSAVVNDNGWITSVTDEVGAKTCYSHDAMGRIASVTYTSETQLYVCDTSRWAPRYSEFRPLSAGDSFPSGIVIGQWRQLVSEGNRTKATYFDSLWRPVLTHEYDTANPIGTLRATRTTFDSSSRVIFQSYPSSDAVPSLYGVRTFYDALNRVIRIEQDSEQGVLETSTEYLAGLQVRVTNPRGYKTTTGFMAWDQPGYDLPLWSSQPEGKLIEIARHSQFGWPLQLKQRSADSSVQQVRSYVYDGNGQLCKTIEPETGATVLGHDDAGNPIWQASGLTGGNYAEINTCSLAEAWNSGRRIVRTYDALNRLSTLEFPDSRGNQSWTYEKDNLPASIAVYNDVGSANLVVTAYAYNKRRLPTGESLSQPNVYTWGVGYEYDNVGNLRWQSYPTGLTLDFAPNALGQATQARNAHAPYNSYVSGAQYFPNGGLKQFTYGNGVIHSMTQNARQLPAWVGSTGNVTDFSYSYDKNGNPTVILDNITGTPTAQHRWMSYDGLDRLTSSASAMFGGTDHTHRFTYDALDNLESWKHAGVKDYADYVYDERNRLISIRNTAGAAVVGIDYDPQGNLTNKNGQTYEFDYGNRLRIMLGKESYRYDGLGRRVQTTKVGGGQVRWQYSQGGQLLYEEDSTTLLSAEHIYFAGSLIATRSRNWSTNVMQTKYQHNDALGSPVAVTNEAGHVIERNNYEPYGGIIGNTARSGIGYTGHVMDGATGLIYMQQRYYDQSIGRFLSMDPVAANSTTGANFNRYWYANNNPYKFVDPDGRWGELFDIAGRSNVVPSGQVSYVESSCASEADGAKSIDGLAEIVHVQNGTVETIVTPWGEPPQVEATIFAVLLDVADFAALKALRINDLSATGVAGVAAAKSFFNSETRVRLTTIVVQSWMGTYEVGFFGDLKKVDFQGLGPERRAVLKIERQTRITYGDKVIVTGGWENQPAFDNTNWLKSEGFPLRDVP